MQVKTYKELVVWQKSMDLVVEVYKLASLLPKDEMYGLASQMKRAAVSMPSNIAEGFRRNHKPEQTQFLSVAYASGAELETQIEICKKLGFCTTDQTKTAAALLDEVMRMLNKLSRIDR
ncbi:MAG: four helix bundle protein [Patescibacteria group bacterium]